MALYSVEEGIFEQQCLHQYASAEFEHFDGVIEQFKHDSGESTFNAAAFAVAGAVIEGTCETTNLPWFLDECALSVLLNNIEVRLLNDVEATAYGMLYLQEQEQFVVNAGVKHRANCAVIAAGTGLGEATLFYHNKQYLPSASEGGHCSFAPQSEQEIALLRFLQQQYGGHVSFERVVSGMGIANIYAFLHAYHNHQPTDLLQAFHAGQNINAEISKRATNQSEMLAQECMALFFQLYAQEAGNLALKSMALGGLFIGGGIITKNLALLNSEMFLTHFSAKGRFEALLRDIPIIISKRSDIALEGAAHFIDDSIKT